MGEMNNIRAWVMPAEKSADFTLLFNVVDERGTPIGTLASVKVEEGMHQRLQDILQTARMVERFSQPKKED